MSIRSVLDVLAAEGMITLTNAAEIRREARKNGVSIEDELFSRGIAEADILKARGEAFGLPIADLSEKKVEFNLLKTIPEESAKRYKFVPLGLEEGVLHVGMLQPDSIEAMEALKFIAGRLDKPFKVFLISKQDFNNVLEEYRGMTGEVSKVLGELETVIAAEAKSSPRRENIAAQAAFVEDAPIIKIVAVILRHATEGRASDIHIEPGREKLRVRFRVDGILYNSLI